MYYYKIWGFKDGYGYGLPEFLGTIRAQSVILASKMAKAIYPKYEDYDIVYECEVTPKEPSF